MCRFFSLFFFFFLRHHPPQSIRHWIVTQCQTSCDGWRVCQVCRKVIVTPIQRSLALYSRQLPVGGCVGLLVVACVGLGFESGCGRCGLGFESGCVVFEFGWCDLPCAGVVCCTEAPWMLLIPCVHKHLYIQPWCV